MQPVLPARRGVRALVMTAAHPYHSVQARSRHFRWGRSTGARPASMEVVMRIAVAATGSDLDAAFVTRLGTCSYLLVVDSETMTCEAIPRPPNMVGAGAGIATVTLAADQDADAILTRYVPPRMEATLRENGINVVTGVTVPVRVAVVESAQAGPPDTPAQPQPAIGALVRSGRQFAAMLPVLIGVMLLAGLFKVFVSAEALAAVYSGAPLTDAFSGACLGSIIGGNAVNSYVIGQALHDSGVSLFAVTAIMITWVTVGVVQLPAEISAFGSRFALSRNAVGFLLAVPLALSIVALVRWLS